MFFDSLTQIVMPSWNKGRVTLIGDACGCLTMIAGQGSHMAMAGAYVLAQELIRYSNDYRMSFSAYGKFLKPIVIKKQNEAAWLAKRFVPSRHSVMAIRRAMMKLIFSKIFLKYSFSFFGSASILTDYV